MKKPDYSTKTLEHVSLADFNIYILFSICCHLFGIQTIKYTNVLGFVGIAHFYHDLERIQTQRNKLSFSLKYNIVFFLSFLLSSSFTRISTRNNKTHSIQSVCY